MKKQNIRIELLEEKDKEKFIKDLQWAFKYGAVEEFGLRDNHFEEDGEIISRATIEKSLNTGTAYSIICGDKKAGGLVVKIFETSGELDLLFVIPNEHSKGIGQTAWFLIEKQYPQVKRWETITPYFEKRNIHFYVNKCGFKIVEFICDFYNSQGLNGSSETQDVYDANQNDGMFRFEKILN